MSKVLDTRSSCRVNMRVGNPKPYRYPKGTTVKGQKDRHSIRHSGKRPRMKLRLEGK